MQHITYITEATIKQYNPIDLFLKPAVIFMLDIIFPNSIMAETII